MKITKKLYDRDLTINIADNNYYRCDPQCEHLNTTKEICKGTNTKLVDSIRWVTPKVYIRTIQCQTLFGVPNE